MPRYRLDIAYDGTAYSGWQRQTNARTVQGTLEEALSRMQGGAAVTTAGASRTDAGVHAEHQVVIFDYEGRLTCNDFTRGLNALTPADIMIRAVHEVDGDFHPRFASAGKWYRYLVWEARHAPPSLAARVWSNDQRLDVDAIVEASQHLVGEHDFSAFRASDCEARSPIRHIKSIEVRTAFEGYLTTLPSETARLITIDVRGNAFLKYMVRVITGTLVEVGRGNRTPDGVRAALESRDRRQAGRTAPARGLTLVKVFFQGSGDRHPESRDEE